MSDRDRNPRDDGDGGDAPPAGEADLEARRAAAHRRLRGFALHLAAYFVVMAVLVAVNFLVTPERAWALFPLVAWGAPLALHAAWAMGLFGVFRR